MGEYDVDGVAERAVVPAAFVARIVDFGIVTAGEDGKFSRGDVRKAQVACTPAPWSSRRATITGRR